MQSNDSTDPAVPVSKEEFLVFKKKGMLMDEVNYNKYGLKLYKFTDRQSKVLIELRGEYFLCPSFEFVERAFLQYEGSFKESKPYTNQSKRTYRSLLEKEKTFSVIDSKGMKHNISNLSSQEFRKIRQEGLEELNGYYEKFGMRVYATKQRSVVVETNMLYSIYPSLELFNDVLKTPQTHSDPTEYGKNVYGQSFPTEVPKLISSMLSDFAIFPTSKNEKVVLFEVDSVINSKRDVSFVNRYFLSFVALVGEYLLQCHGGAWQMALSNDNETWIPYLEINGRKMFFADHLKEDIDNLQNKKPLTEVFETIESLIHVNKQ